MTLLDGVALAAPARARAVIIDADRRIRQSLADLLRIGGMDVVGTAGGVREALDLRQRLRPSVAIVDPRLPDIDAGAALISSLRLADPQMRIIVMGWSPDPEHAIPGEGICAFVAKGATPEDFIAATVAACGG